ncbi:L-seryl-tRNA(Sec) selenium transferase [uncultured Anaerococcus sp.]|uniref:L-seryl-tRNA(Sec) selenium transferase n=1 Tax=uncultured Anaerococcus sp. TaxID=293428 RepID=UPI002608730C|nr:L-seryl-tRNA(Sec) selenium transferase [uncultured Anaerococcus sp.]
MENLYKKLPQMNDILTRFNTNSQILKDIANAVLDEYRLKIAAKESFETDEIYDEIDFRFNNYSPYSLYNVINATGVILHTNLGRAVLSENTSLRIEKIAKNYSNLEYDVDKGKRGSRYTHLVDIVKKLTGAEDALIVNNNAAAVFLVLNTFCKNKDAVISRGELVEIGGSFRINEIMKESGANVVEVGATNRTHLYDYERAIDEYEEVSAIVKVHKSNFQMVGYEETVDTREIKELIRDRDILLYEDLGSGSLIDLSPYGFSYEKTVIDCLNDGIDLVSFSCDKLIGSSQAGIIVGKKSYIDRMKKNQLLRAFRVDKLTLASVEASLYEYLDFDKLKEENPTIRMILEDSQSVKQRGEKLLSRLQSIEGFEGELVESDGKIGGGSYPLDTKKTYSVKILYEDASKLESFLRLSKNHIISTVYNGYVHLNALTIFENQIDDIFESLREFYEK